MRFSFSRPNRSKSAHFINFNPDEVHQPAATPTGASSEGEEADGQLQLQLQPQQLQQEQRQHQQQQYHKLHPYHRSIDLGSAEASATGRSAHTACEHSRTAAGRHSGDRHSLAAYPSRSRTPDVEAYDITHAVPSIPTHLRRVNTLSQAELSRASESVDSVTCRPPDDTWVDERRASQRRSDPPYLLEAGRREVSASPRPNNNKRLSARLATTTPIERSTMPPPPSDSWSQRWLQRYNTEQSFREQRQGGPPSDSSSVVTPPTTRTATSSSSSPQPAPVSVLVQPESHVVPFPETQPILRQPPSARSSAVPNKIPDIAQQLQPPSSAQSQLQLQPRSSSLSHVSQLHINSVTGVSQPCANTPSPLSSDGAGNKAPRPSTSHRQSVHNIAFPRDVLPEHAQLPTQLHPPAMISSASPSNQQTQPVKTSSVTANQADTPRTMQQPPQNSEDFTPEDVLQLLKDHRELREKYTKVKKYYFEKEEQVKQLQNSLAHQRLSQSRTSLDDSEYATRFNRLDGLIAQLAFGIRKSWKSMPTWLANSINKDAVETGKQEMTAAGRAIISCWLVEEVFDKYFHPDLEPSLSMQLKGVERNLRRSGPTVPSLEEADSNTSKIINWRLATLEGLQDAFRSSQCPQNRQQLTDYLRSCLIDALAAHLQDPPPSDLEGGVHMIMDLVVGIAAHLPLESRDVVVEYFWPGQNIVLEQMKIESGIPQLTTSITDDAADRASTRSDAGDGPEGSSSDQPQKKRSVLSALTGGDRKSKASASGRANASNGASGSQSRPGSPHTPRDEAAPRVRISAGIGVQVHGRSILVKAPVFST